MRDDSGSASVELLGFVPYLLLAALAAWQLLLTAMTVTAAENAARTGSRAAVAGEDGIEAAEAALPSWLRQEATPSADGDRITVRIEVPIVVPVLSTGAITITRDADMPALSAPAAAALGTEV